LASLLLPFLQSVFQIAKHVRRLIEHLEENFRMIIETRSSMQFSESIKEGVKLVVFWLPLSQPCLSQSPVLIELSEELKDKLGIINVNAQDVPSLTQQYDVQAIPTLLLFQDGREVNRFIGVHSKNTLLDAVNHFLVSEES
jgi:thioredoxin 1